MKREMKRIRVYLWDNDPLMQHYKVGTYEVVGYLLPYKMYEDIMEVSRKHHVCFAFSDVLDSFIDAVLYGAAKQHVSVDCSMFLEMEVIDGD